MKKHLCVLLIVLITLSVTACGQEAFDENAEYVDNSVPMTDLQMKIVEAVQNVPVNNEHFKNGTTYGDIIFNRAESREDVYEGKCETDSGSYVQFYIYPVPLAENSYYTVSAMFETTAPSPTTFDDGNTSFYCEFMFLGFRVSSDIREVKLVSMDYCYSIDDYVTRESANDFRHWIKYATAEEASNLNDLESEGRYIVGSSEELQSLVEECFIENYIAANLLKDSN